MARVSKKVSAAQREAENAPHRIWKTAIYARLSDFDDVLRDTESLEVQISYIKEYINHRDNLMLLDVFADKRCTGMNFDRPEFERLLKALQERKVNCIVVKDFSRLGRNFVETGQYLEQVFPLFGVRFIAINDNYDSLNSQSRDGMLVPIKSMINEMYSKDLSQKIQSCFRSKEARGEIYMPVPFGYKRNQQNHLILDEEVSDVVVRIFLWKKSGMKEREIAKKLTAQGIQTPFTRRCQLGYLKNTLRFLRQHGLQELHPQRTLRLWIIIEIMKVYHMEIRTERMKFPRRKVQHAVTVGLYVKSGIQHTP